MNKSIAIAAAAFLMALFVLLIGCEKRFDLLTLPKASQVSAPGETTYVEIFPPLIGFSSPRAVLVGNDHLIYVADYDSNQIVMLDAGGSILGRKHVPHPISLAQNSKLDLYAGGDTLLPNSIDTVGAVYRIFLARFDTVYNAYDTLKIQFGDTTVVHVYRDTSYFADHDFNAARVHLVWKEPARPRRRYTGIGILPGNEYFVTRNGPDNTSFVDPDCRVLRFNRGDTLITPLGDLTTRPSGGTGITDIRSLTGIMVFPSSRNFLVTQTTDGVVYGAIPMQYILDKERDGWFPIYDPSDPATRGADIIRPYRFKNAVCATYDNKRREIFILDEGLDSVVKFNSRGQFRSESFGKYITTTDQFPGLNHPMGISFSGDCTLYIADTGNKVIRRFRLSTQAQCN